MENRDWGFYMYVHKYDTMYYAQHKSAYNDDDVQILQSDLTKSEAMALLSLTGTPLKSIDGYYHVCVEK
jgi:hypothetical protein